MGGTSSKNANELEAMNAATFKSTADQLLECNIDADYYWAQYENLKKNRDRIIEKEIRKEKDGWCKDGEGNNNKDAGNQATCDSKEGHEWQPGLTEQLAAKCDERIGRVVSGTTISCSDGAGQTRDVDCAGYKKAAVSATECSTNLDACRTASDTQELMGSGIPTRKLLCKLGGGARLQEVKDEGTCLADGDGDGPCKFNCNAIDNLVHFPAQCLQQTNDGVRRSTLDEAACLSNQNEKGNTSTGQKTYTWISAKWGANVENTASKTTTQLIKNMQDEINRLDSYAKLLEGQRTTCESEKDAALGNKAAEQLANEQLAASNSGYETQINALLPALCTHREIDFDDCTYDKIMNLKTTTVTTTYHEAQLKAEKDKCSKRAKIPNDMKEELRRCEGIPTFKAGAPTEGDMDPDPMVVCATSAAKDALCSGENIQTCKDISKEECKCYKYMGSKMTLNEKDQANCTNDDGDWCWNRSKPCGEKDQCMWDASTLTCSDNPRNTAENCQKTLQYFQDETQWLSTLGLAQCTALLSNVESEYVKFHDNAWNLEKVSTDSPTGQTGQTYHNQYNDIWISGKKAYECVAKENFPANAGCDDDSCNFGSPLSCMNPMNNEKHECCRLKEITKA